MIFYSALFLVGLCGFLFVILRHQRELSEQYDTFLSEHPANFAHMMSVISSQFYQIWNVHLRDQLLLVLEKRLRWFRIIVLRVEHFLFRATHRVRDASNRNDISTNIPPEDTNIDSDKRAE